MAGRHGPHRSIVLLNTAAALVVAGRAATLEEGLAVATATIDSGAAAATLDRLVVESQAAAVEAAAQTEATPRSITPQACRPPDRPRRAPALLRPDRRGRAPVRSWFLSGT